MTATGQQLTVFIGSYAEVSASGVYMFAFDEKEGTLKLLDEASGMRNPTYLNVDAANRRLYAIAEGVTEDGAKGGDAVAFAIETEGDKPSLRQLNRALAITAPSCHIQRDADSKFLMLASYHGGRVSLASLEENGEVGQLLDIVQHEGEAPHPHSLFFSPDRQFVFVPDLGIDRIRSYRLDKELGKLVFHGETSVPDGAGPRHLVFHPNGHFVYVINELNSTVAVFRYEADGSLQSVQTITTLPSDFEGSNSCAEITMSEDGRFVYGSNRGHDSIVVYAADSESGKLELIGHVSTEGKHPRHFAILPGGRYLIAANKDTNNLAVFKLEDNGLPVYTGYSVELPQPVCVQAAYF
ncbi:lactonase family protein [Paenibacillus sp. NPDC058071]|uniref:lactonase family protein n=1 Tax=Paenibacillus sp. NPDC058071 TaxID=3346326 RepID=UPI0036D9CCDC